MSPPIVEPLVASRRLVRAIEELSQARSLEQIMAIVRRAARTITGADGASFILAEDDLCYFADEDAVTPLWKGVRIHQTNCISGWVVHNRKAAIIPDVLNDPRLPPEVYRPTFVRSMLMVPIGIEAPVGAIGVYWPVVREATAAEAEYLQALANSTATAMETLQRNVQPDARTRLSGSAARAGFLANDEIIPGTLLDERYRLDEKIGVGGYGAVYRGHDLFDDRPIAVKVCRPQATLIDQNAIERFFREGLWTSRVRHPNAVEVYAYSVTSDSVPYLVMELLNGRTLAQELRICTRLSLSRALPILEQSASALAAAHEQGILHRDIKPDNLFLHTTPDGKVVAKLLDFGSAKPLDTQVGEPFNALTAAGQVLGTPHFIAPERWTNQNVDGRSDVYSLGVSMMVALEGYVSLRQTQFQAVVSSHSELVTAVYTAPVGHTAVSQRPQLPLLVVQLMERAMNNDPLLRPTAAEFATEIHQLHAALPADQ